MAETAQKWGDWASQLAQRKRHYETIFIVSPGIDEARLKDITEKLDRVGQETEVQFLRQDNWGKLRMAYEMDKHATGNYFYYRYIGNNQSVKALERSLKLDADVLRFQTVRLSDELSKEEVDNLVQRAPKEASVPPNANADEESDFH